MVKLFGRWAAWALGIFGAVLAIGVLECLVVEDWRHYFFNILSLAVDYFLPTIGTSGIGFHSYYAIPLLVVLIGVILVRVEQGRAAMLTHWGEAKLAARVILIALAIYFVPIFCWCFAKAIYQDHARLAADNLKLSQKVEVLTADIENRKNNFGPASGPVYDHVRGLLYAFIAFRGKITAPPTASCVIKVTAPSDSGPIVMTFSEFTTIASGIGVCGPGDSRMDPDEESETRRGAIPGVVVMHTSRDFSDSLALYGALASMLPMKRSYEMPKNSPNTVIWFQFGSGVKWVR
jgi:hypothetical protein